jgi:hypothetical protein
MGATLRWGALALAAGTIAACGSGTAPMDGDAGQEAPDVGAAVGYEPVASILDLMRGTITFAAETYWESVMIVWDENGETIHQPQSDEEWQEIWSAGITLAEAGNLLMLPREGFPDDPAWIALSQQLRQAGIDAAQAALRKDYMEVLEIGNTVYNACVACHEAFVPTLNRL